MAKADLTQGRTGISRVSANVLSNWGSFAFSAVVSFFLSPFIVRHLGASSYGVWTLVVSLTGYLGLLDMGVRGAVTRYVAKFHATGEQEQLTGIVSSAFSIFVAAGTIAILVSIGLSLFAVPHFSISAAYLRSTRFVLVIAGVTVATSLISGVFGGVVIGMQRFDLSNLIEALSTAIRAPLIVFALVRGGGIVALSEIQLGFSVLALVVYWLLAKRLCPTLKIQFDQTDRQRLKLILSFSGFSFVLQMSDYMVYYTDSVVIGTFLPVSAITFFAIASNLMSYARAPISSISVIMTPLASSVEAKNDCAQVRRVTLKASRYATAIMLPVAITFLIRGKSFIGLWMGPGYAELSGRVLAILTLPWLFSAGNGTLCAVMMGLNKHKGVVPAQLAEGVCNLALSIVLVRHMGIVGVAWGTTIPNLAFHLLFWPWYLRKILNIPISTHVGSTWIRPLAASIPFAVCTWGVERWLPASDLAIFFLQVLSVIPIWLVSAWFFVIEGEDRKHLIAPISSGETITSAAGVRVGQ